MNSETSYSFLRKYTPNGTQTLSKMPDRYVNGVYPKVLSFGKGGRVRDVEGREYVDIIAGLGAISLGYVNDFVNSAVINQLSKGVSFSLPTILEAEVSQLLTRLVSHTDMWKFGKTGTEGTLMAIRCAKAYTNRDKVMTVGYNGCADIFEANGTRKAGMFDLRAFNTRATYNNLLSFEALKSNRYACVLLEPMVFDEPENGFLQQLRELCTQTGTLLIFDEVVTGGRFEGFVAQSYFKVVPDLTVLSKGIANGFPLSAVGGKRPVMETFERDDFFASGTFGGECVSLAAAYETLIQLKFRTKSMVQMGIEIQDEFNSLECGVCKGYPTRLTFDFPTPTHKALFMQEMCKNGVLVGYTNFVMADMTHRDIDQVISAVRRSIGVIKENWNNPEFKLEGDMPVESLRLRK